MMQLEHHSKHNNAQLYKGFYEVAYLYARDTVLVCTSFLFIIFSHSVLVLSYYTMHFTV